ncbi:MAG: methyltransferase domain-containing protein [Chloroflexi bacterium]|nr:methyltransferase domain-containing protein [Chloroflexota bacterium]
MKRRLLDYLACPACHAGFRLVAETPEPEVLTGELACQGCGRTYPILRGIPRLLPDSIAADKARTADTFGWEWQEFHSLHDVPELYQQQFLDWVHPLEPEFFRGKVVLDAGCGMGRFAAASASFGAREVVAVDLSEAVEAAYRNTRDLPNVHVVQGDIYHLPFARPFDFAFSIGVLHHLPDPEGGFLALVRHLKPGGSIFAWVYGRENNGWIVHAVNPLREKLFSRLPHPVLYALSHLMTLILHPLLKLLYRPANLIPWLRPLARALPYNGYLSWLAQFGFRHNHHVIFDHLAAPTAFYIRREEFLGWFRKASLSRPQLSWRNQNSWRGWAVLEHADSGP